MCVRTYVRPVLIVRALEPTRPNTWNSGKIILKGLERKKKEKFITLLGSADVFKTSFVAYLYNSIRHAVFAKTYIACVYFMIAVTL